MNRDLKDPSTGKTLLEIAIESGIAIQLKDDATIERAKEHCRLYHNHTDKSKPYPHVEAFELNPIFIRAVNWAFTQAPYFVRVSKMSTVLFATLLYLIEKAQITRRKISAEKFVRPDSPLTTNELHDIESQLSRSRDMFSGMQELAGVPKEELFAVASAGLELLKPFKFTPEGLQYIENVPYEDLKSPIQHVIDGDTDPDFDGDDFGEDDDDDIYDEYTFKN